MGGFNSGNRWQSGKQQVENCQRLSINDIRSQGLFKAPGLYVWRWLQSGATVSLDTTNNHSMGLKYSKDGEQVSYWVSIDRTEQRLGGERLWFICPSTRCQRRCAMLYYRGNGYFLCRKCQGLAYRTTQSTKADRPFIKLERIRRRLGWEPGYLNGEGCKPKGMRWPTFERLKAEHDRCARALDMQLFSLLGRFRR